jgi:hypothetical protein
VAHRVIRWSLSWTNVPGERKKARMEDRILTLHPQGKQGVNISKQKYDDVRQAIVDALRTHGELTFTEPTEKARHQLADSFQGSVNWYVTTVKLDLEAKGIIERIPGNTPQRLRLRAG